MISTSACYLISFLIGYNSRRNVYLGTLDPLKILSLQEAAWASTVFSLYVEDSITTAQGALFALTIIVWWVSWAVFSALAGKRYRNTMGIFWKRVAALRKKEFIAIFVLYFISATVFFVATL